MELILVRHGLPLRVVNVASAADPELDPRGRSQAEAMAAYLAPERLHAVWASPMRRAFQTAEPLAAALGLAVQVDDDLAEWDRNSTEYIPVEELKAANDPRWQALVKGEWTSEHDPVTFQKTVVAAMERVVEAHKGQRVAVVCHGGVINAYLAHVLGVPRPEGFFHPDYTSIHRVMAASSGERSVRSLNEVAHLRGTPLHITV